ncbi:Dynein heavy chain domain-containing protein, partial [Schistosoma japonicum]
LIPKQQFHQIQSIQHGLYTDQTHLNITGHNCFPTLESISQWGLDSLIEQQCEAMNLYGCLMMPWSEIIYEKTNNIILSIEWIVNMNETVNELNTILQNEDLYTELHKYQRLFQTSVQWINSLQNHNNLLNDNRSNKLQCFILIDYSPLFNLLRNQLMEKLHKLFSIYIPIVQNSLISINNQLDDFIHTHSNIPPDFNGFIQVTTYLNHVHMCHEKLSKDHENLCRQVEFIQHFQKCEEFKCLHLIQLSSYEQFIIKWKKLTNQIEWARRKFFRYRKEFYLHYKKNIKETLKEVEYLVDSLTTGKYSDVNYDAQCILNDMKEPYCRLIKLETYIHQLVDQYKTVQHCEENEEAHEKSQVEKINMFNSHQAMMKTPPTLEKNDVVKSCRTDFKQTKYFNETNKDLLRMDNEMKKVNCRYDAWELKARIGTFKQELYETKLGEVSLNVFNENYQKLVTICNNLQNDDIIVQYNIKCLKVMKTMIKLLSYIMDSDLLTFSSDYWIQCSNLLNLPFNMKWEHCTINDLMKDDKNNLLKQKDKLKEIWQIFHYSMFIQQMKITIENQFNSLNVQFMSMRSHTELIKSVHSSFRNEYVEQLNKETISGRNSNRSDALTTKIHYPWIFLNIDNLLEKLCELSSKLQSLLDSELLNTTKPNEAKSSSLLLTNEKEYYLVKRLKQTKNALYNIKLTQDYWLYLYRLYSLKQFNEELSSSQFLELTDSFIQLENRLLSNDHVVTNQFIECEDNEMFQVNCIDLQSFTNVINSEWELWLTLKDSLYKNVNMFNGPIEEMCETFPLFCLLSKMERISLVCNWFIPFYDYAAPPLKCSIQDVIDTEYTSCQYYLNDITKNYGLINLNKWIKRLFPFLINCIMIWCKGENCWKITNVINEFNQSIPLLVTIKWLPSINQWFIQFYNILQLTFLTITLNSMLTYKESNKKLMNEFIQNKPLISLELTERIIIWQKLENIIRKEKKNDEFNEIIEYLEERLNNTTELLNISFNCDKQIKSRIKQLTCQFLIGTILGFIHLIQDLKKEANLNEDNFLWQRLIKTQLINSIWNHKENDELENVYNEFPMIGIKQFSSIHLYKWDNQSLLLNNNSAYIPLSNTSQELIQLGSAMINHEFGLLVGSTGIGKQTLIRQLAFILGRHLLEFSPDDAFNHSNLDTFEKRLKNYILNCLRIGGLFSIMNMHTLKYGELEIVINCMDEIKKCNFMENCRNQFVGFTLDLQHAVDNINKNSHKLIIHQSNQHNSYSKQCLFNQNIRIDCGFGLFGTFDLQSLQNISEAQRITFRNITIDYPNWLFIIKCLLLFYLPGYYNHSIIQQLIKLFNRSSIDEFIQTISNQMNNYFTLSIIIKSFEFAKQFWLKTLKQLQYQRKTTPITSLIRLNNEEDKLAKMSIIYGLIKVNRINLFIDNNNNNQDNNLKNLLVHSKLIEMNWLLTIEQYLSITSTISCIDECKHYLNCTNYMYPKVSWEFIHRLFREIHLHNLTIINNQLIKIIELWQLIHFNRPILIIGPAASGKSTILKILISTINSYQYTNSEKCIKCLPTLPSSSKTSSSPPSSSSISPSSESICTTSSSIASTLTSSSSSVDSKHSAKPDSFLIFNQPTNENKNKDDIHLTSKHTMNIFRIPDQLIAYLNEFNLILNETDSIHFNVNNNKIISLKHLFPYSNEYLINFFSQNDANDLHIDTLNIIEEWLLLDLSDQSIDHLTFLDESNIFNLLKVVKHLNYSRKLFIEKTTIADLSPGLIHRFSLCSIEVNDELLWSHLWRIWCRTSYSKYMTINSIWDKILSELDNLIPVILDETWEFVNQSCYRDVDDDDGGTSSLLNMKLYKNAFYQQNIKNLLALISELLKIYFPKELWELRRNGKRPVSTYQSNIAIIDYFWSEWRNFEDRSEFYEILIRNLFVFSFIWGIGGSFAGDPRLKSRFETIILRVLKDFIKLPVSLNIESVNNLPPSSSSSSPSSSTLELYYAQQINHCLNGYTCSTASNNKWSYNKNEESGETVDIFQYSLFNCLVDLRTGYLTPFWYTDSYQLHWPEEYDIIIPGESRQYTKPLLPTLFHLSVHLFTGSLFIQSDRPMIISGPNGSGKSQLAIAISQNIEQYKVLIGSKQQHQQQHRHHHKNTRSFRIQSSEFLKRIISNSQINNHDINITVQRHKSTSYKMNLMNKLIILEDVHLISKTLKVQRIWNQELRNQLNNHFNYSKSQSKFIPILTTLDDHHKNRTYSHFPMKLNSLMYQFAFIQLTDPCLLFSKEMNINGFLQEQNVYGFSPISLLCQLMMGHELSRISGILVERFSWIIWYMHCSLMKERCIHGSASVDWLTSQKIAYAMGYHLKKYYSYATTNEILLNCSVISNDINKHIYSRWAPLMLSESIQPNPVYQSSKVLESVLFLCQEVKRYFSPLLPRNSSSEWLFTHLSKSFEYYLMKPSPLGLLIPISYLLFGPSGSLFLNSKITRQSIVHLTVNSPMKSEDIPISTLLHSVYDSTKLPTSSISPYKSFSLTSKSSSSTFTTCCTHSTAITSTTITSVSTYSDTTLSSSSQFNSKHYSSNYSTTSVNTSSYDSLVYVCSSSSLPVPSSSTHSLSNLCSIPSVTTATTTSSTSSDNLLVTTPTLSTSTLTNQISFHENNKIVEPHTIRNHNEFTKQIETLCSKLNDEIETSLSICAQPNYSRYYNIKHKEVSYMNHQSWAKYGLLNPHLVPSNTLPGCLEVTTNLETMFVNLKNDLFMNFNVEFNYDNATLQYMIRNAMNMICSALTHNPCYILLINSTPYKTCGIISYLQKQIIHYVIKLKNDHKTYYTKCIKDFLKVFNEDDDNDQQTWTNGKQYDMFVIDISNQYSDQSFNDNDDDELYELTQMLHEIRFYLPWEEISNEMMKSIFIITSNNSKILNPLIQCISWDCVINFSETTDHLQLKNLELKTITNNIDLHQASFLKSFLLNHYLSSANNAKNCSILCDIFTEAHLLILQHSSFNQDSTSTLINQKYSLNYLIQTIHVWSYLEYCQQNKQNNKQLLCNQLNETNLLFHSMKNGYHSLEKQITEANSMLEVMKKDLVNYQELYLPEAKLKYTNEAEQLQYLKEQIMHKENELSRLRKPMDRIKKLAEIEFDKLKNAYRLAVQGLHNLSIEDLDEVRSYREPPDAVKECVYLICMLMDEEEDWENAKHMMVPVKFISKILKLPTQPLNKHKHHELRKRLTSSETLTQDNLLQVSVATARLCEWLRALCGCFDANECLHNHINEYSSIEVHVNNTESLLGNLYLTLHITELNIEIANNHLIECEHQYKHLSENINTLEYKINEAKSLLSTIQSNLPELYNDNNDYVTDVNQNLPFWFNILGALGTVYCQILPTKYRTSLWNHFKNLVWHKMKEINHETRNNKKNENQIIDEKLFNNLQLFQILQIESYEIMKWFTMNTKLPLELILCYHNQQVSYIIEAVLAIRTILWSIKYRHNQQNDYNTVNESILCMFIFDPDQIGIDLLKFSLISINNDNNKKDQLISDIYIEAKDFIPNFNYNIYTDKIILINVDQFDCYKAKENIQYLLNFYFNQTVNKNTLLSQILLWTSFSETTEIGTRCRQKFSQMELISIDLGLSSLEYGMAFASCLLNLLPKCKVLSSLQEIRSTEIDTYEKICDDKSQLLNLSKELTTLKLFHSDINKSLLTKHYSIQFNVDCLNVTKQHIELVKLFSRLSTNQMHLKEIQFKCEYLNNQISIFMHQNNKISSIGSFMLKISSLFNILNEIHSDDSILFSWPCKRLCKYITSKYANLYSNCLKENHEINLSSDLYLYHEYEIQEVSRCILRILLEFILNPLNNWNNPLGLIIQIELCIYLNVLQYSNGVDNKLHNSNHLNEIQLFKQIIYSNIYTNEYDCQHCFSVNQSEVLKRIRLLEEKLPTLNGLEKAFLANPLIWTEIKLNSFHSLPGFPTTQVIPESHVFLVWISIRHEMFYVISKEFVNLILAQYITPYNNKGYLDKSFEAEKRLRTDELFQPQIIKPVPGYYSYSNKNSFSSSTIYLILPNELNEFKNKDFLIKYQSKQPITSSNGLQTALQKMAMYSNRTLFSIDCINTTDISYWLSLCGSNTNTFPYQRILFILRNVHIIDKEINQQLDEFLQYGLYNLRYKQMHSIQDHEYNLSLVNKLGILFDIVVDFTCCQSWKQLISVYNKLPSWLRSTCLPLLFDCKDDQSLFRISPWKQISLIDRKEKPTNYQQENANESMNRENIQLWLKEIDGFYEKLESE